LFLTTDGNAATILSFTGQNRRHNMKRVILKSVIVLVLLAGVTAWAQTGPFGIATIAGTPYDPSGDNGPATQASIGLAGSAFRAGNLYVTDGNRIRKIDPTGRITTIVGLLDPVVHQPIGGYSGDGGPALAALVHGADSLDFDSQGNLYIADNANFCVRKLTARIVGGTPQPFDGSEIITTVAGVCLFEGNSGDGGPATSAKINFPRGVAVDPVSGALYIADFANQNVRKVLGGTITTIAGTGAAGYSGDGGPATAAKLNGPAGVAVNPATGDVFIADLVNNRVRKVSAGIITTVAGTGSSSASGNLNEGGAAIAANVRPTKIRFAAGTLYVADSGVSTIRTIGATGIITTVAGIGLGPYTGPFPPAGDGGPAGAASFKSVQEPALDGQGGLFILDSSAKRIRYAAGAAATVLGQTVAAGDVATVAGPPGATTFSGDGGAAILARLFSPGALVADLAGNIYVTDGGNNRVREISAARTIQTIAGTGSAGFSGVPGPATSAIIQPGSLALGSDGLYLTSNGSHALKLAAGELSIVANLTGATSPPSANGTPAVQALLAVGSIVFDATGNLYVGDGTNNRLWKIDGTGTVKTVAGGGTEVIDGITITSAPATSAMVAPGSLAFDPSGNLYMTDTNQNRIYKIAAHSYRQPLDGTETVTLFAGTGGSGYSGDGGPATAATLSFANGLVFDKTGDLYLNDNNYRIRMIDSHGIISTVAGTGTAGFSGDGGQAALANIRGGSMAFDSYGNLYLSDGVNQVVRVLDNTPPALTFGTPVPAPNASGWYNTSVTIPFNASDTGAGVASTNPAGPLVLSGQGSAVSGTVTATDRAGNSANFTSPVVKIDMTAPVISGMPGTGCSLWPPNGKMVQVATVTATDAPSGLAPGSFQVTGTSNEPPSAPEISITANGSGGYVIALESDRLGNGNGRTYTLTATARDLAGNTSTVTATCTVPHDQGK
jgi:sugar lactone lactonase YvrE